ncbi:MAG: hypothetical protein R2700_16115 [Solirubrobacterales bacterium]
MNEYDFVPSKVTAQSGSTAIEAENVGKMPHELVLAKSDLDPAKLPTEGGGGVDEAALDIVGETGDVEPGETGTVNADLEPGSYVMFCNLPAALRGRNVRLADRQAAMRPNRRRRPAGAGSTAVERRAPGSDDPALLALQRHRLLLLGDVAGVVGDLAGQLRLDLLLAVLERLGDLRLVLRLGRLQLQLLSLSAFRSLVTLASL